MIIVPSCIRNSAVDPWQESPPEDSQPLEHFCLVVHDIDEVRIYDESFIHSLQTCPKCDLPRSNAQAYVIVQASFHLPQDASAAL